MKGSRERERAEDRRQRYCWQTTRTWYSLERFGSTGELVDWRARRTSFHEVEDSCGPRSARSKQYLGV